MVSLTILLMLTVISSVVATAAVLGGAVHVARRIQLRRFCVQATGLSVFVALLAFSISGAHATLVVEDYVDDVSAAEPAALTVELVAADETAEPAPIEPQADGQLVEEIELNLEDLSDIAIETATAAADEAERAEDSSSSDAAAIMPKVEDAAGEYEFSGGRRFVVLHKQDRPCWVEQPPHTKGDGDHWTAVSSDPWKTEFEAHEALSANIRQAVDAYIDNYIGRSDAARRVRFPDEFVLGELVAEKYSEDLQFADSAIGTMKQVHAKVVFTPEFRAQLAQRWKEQVVTARLLQTSLAIAAVLGLLITAFVYLKTDTATGGSYSGRLMTAAIGVILALVVSGLIVARWIPWL